MDSLFPREPARLDEEVWHYPDWLSWDEQVELLALCRGWLAPPAGAVHPRMPNGTFMSVSTACLGWYWYPYRYSRTLDDTTGEWVKAFPSELSELAVVRSRTPMVVSPPQARTPRRRQARTPRSSTDMPMGQRWGCTRTMKNVRTRRSFPSAWELRVTSGLATMRTVTSLGLILNFGLVTCLSLVERGVGPSTGSPRCCPTGHL